MVHAYTVEGMTCGGCQASVKSNLEKLSEVNKVDVLLEEGRVMIYSDRPFSIDELQAALPSKYRIFENAERPSMTVSRSAQKSKLAQLKPLFLILSYVFMASILLNIQDWSFRSMMYDYMGLFFIVFSFFKVLDLSGFAQSFRMYDPMARLVPAYGYGYPFIEIALGLLFLFRIKLGWAIAITIFVLGITTIGVARTLLSKKTIQCACLGTTLDLPMTEATLIENAIMLVMGVMLLA